MQADAVARVVITTLAVASGTGAFVALATGHRASAIGLAVCGGVLTIGATLGQALERENGHSPAATTAPTPPAVVGTTQGVAVRMAGVRMMGRG